MRTSPDFPEKILKGFLHKCNISVKIAKPRPLFQILILAIGKYMYKIVCLQRKVFERSAYYQKTLEKTVFSHLNIHFNSFECCTGKSIKELTLHNNMNIPLSGIPNSILSFTCIKTVTICPGLNCKREPARLLNVSLKNPSYSWCGMS